MKTYLRSRGFLAVCVVTTIAIAGAVIYVAMPGDNAIEIASKIIGNG